MYKLVAFALLTALVSFTAPAWSCMQYDPLPSMVAAQAPDENPEEVLPCYSGTPAPRPGSVLVYDVDGSAHWFTPFGVELGTSENVLATLGGDNVRVEIWAFWAGVSKGEYMQIIQNAQRASGRALRVSEMIP